MAKNSTASRRTKHVHLLPYADFPLSPHVATGRWYKSIRGVRVYFGPLADPQAALEKYQNERDDLYAGRTPRPSRDGFTIRDAANHFLTAKQRALAASEITRRTFTDYKATTDGIVASFGLNRLVADLAADDFGAYRAALAKRLGPVPLGNEIQRVRTVFKFCLDNGLIQTPVRFGSEFAKPQRRVIRIARQRARQEHGSRMFEAKEIRALLDKASPQVKAMILLAINGGFGNNDLGTMPLSAVNLDGGWIDYARPKSGIARRCPLWPETVKAVRQAIDARPEPADMAAVGLVFLTRFGRPWIRYGENGKLIDGIGHEIFKLLTDLGIKRHGVAFYALRHTFLTVAEESMDKPAVDFIMGHADESMADRYRERISDERLKRVVGLVHGWLFGEGKSKRKGNAPDDQSKLRLVV